MRTTSCAGWRRQRRSSAGIDRLAISPQCGFASVMVGNEIAEETQWRKFELVGRVADHLWSFTGLDPALRWIDFPDDD